MEKQVVSFRINPSLYQKLKNEVGNGRISHFIESLIDKELDKQDKKLVQEYQEAAQDKKRRKEADEWDMAQLVDWNNQDDGENN